MSNKKKKIIICALLIIQIIVVGFFATYSWFESDFDPVIYSGDLYITATEGLTVQLSEYNENDPNSRETIDITDVVRDIPTDLFLSQVSSIDGINFYKRKVIDDVIRYEEAEKGKDYLEVTFMLSNDEERTRNIYLNKLAMSLYAENNELNDILVGPLTDELGNILNYTFDAIRFSITYEINDVERTYIMALGSSRLDNDYTNLTTIVENQEVIGYELDSAVRMAGLSDETPSILQDELIQTGLDFVDCLGTQRVLFSKQFNSASSNPLFTLNPSHGVKFTLRIWLEGADPKCSLPISGTKVFLDMLFGEGVSYHKIDFNCMGGSNIPSIMIENGNVPTLSSIPVKDGFSFDGWYLDKQYSNIWNSSQVTNDLMLYAKYTELNQ